MRKILMMAVLAFLSLQGVGARASGISLLESGKKKLVAQEDTVKKDTVKKVTAYEKLLKDGGSECEGMFTVRHIKDNWYFEVPDTLLGRLLLAVTRFKAVPQGFIIQAEEHALYSPDRCIFSYRLQSSSKVTDRSIVVVQS